MKRDIDDLKQEVLLLRLSGCNVDMSYYNELLDVWYNPLFASMVHTEVISGIYDDAYGVMKMKMLRDEYSVVIDVKERMEHYESAITSMQNELLYMERELERVERRLKRNSDRFKRAS